MASAKLILRTDKKNKQGLCPLYLLIIKHRKTTFVFFDIRLGEEDWDKDPLKVKKSHKNSGRMNANIAQKVADAEGIIVDTETKAKNISTRRLKERIIGIDPVSFFDYSKRYTDSLLARNQIATYKRALAVIQKLKDYNEDKPLYLDDITYIYRFYRLLHMKPAPQGRVLCFQTIISLRAGMSSLKCKADHTSPTFILLLPGSSSGLLISG